MASRLHQQLASALALPALLLSSSYEHDAVFVTA
jgi:hypothetical protein